MPNLRLSGFGGERPSIDPRYLPETAAQKATNVFLTSGRIDPMSQPTSVGRLRAQTCKSVYEFIEGLWFSWETDTDVARSPVTNDTLKRFYFSSEGFEPRVTTYDMATNSAQAYPASWWALGVVAPITAPTVAVTGGSGTLESRVYCYTFVSPWGEESAPSPASSIVTGYPTGTWTLSGFDAAPTNTGTITSATYNAPAGEARLVFDTVFGLRQYELIKLTGPLTGEYKIKSIDVATKTVAIEVSGISTVTTGTWARTAYHNTVGMTRRIYRSVTSSTGTDFYFVAEVSGTITSYTDATTAANLGEPLATLGWEPPPADLQGIAVLPCGALVGFRDNEVCFSELMTPYAWPQAYRITTDYKIVGLGILGASIIVGTTGQPYVVAGNEPAAMTPQRLDQAWPCLSKRGIVSFNNAVYYPTTAGLAMISSSGSGIATEGLYTQREWVKTNPQLFIGGHYDNKYYGASVVDNNHVVYIIDPGAGVSELNLATDALYSNPRDGFLYSGHNWFVYRLGTTEGVAIGGEWRSKKFVLPKPTNMGAAKVEAQFTMTPEQIANAQAYNDSLIAANNALFSSDKVGPFGCAAMDEYTYNGSAMKNLMATFTQSVQFMLYEDGKLIFTKPVTDEKVFRLPAGNKYYNFEIGIATNIPVYAVLIGDSPKALEQV